MKALVNIDVPDLQAAVRFYESAVGLVLSRVIEADVAEMCGASSVVYLMEKQAGSPSSPTGDTRSYARHWTPVHVDFVVEDVEAASARAVRAGAVRETEAVVWRGSRCITLSDPFGNGFCFIQFAEGSYLGDE